MPLNAQVRASPAVPSPDISDLTAVREVLQGDREMFRIIVHRYNTRLYRVGMAYLRNHAQTEDAMQNAYLKAFQNLRRFHGTAAFATWLTRIMINECLMTIRREKRFAVMPVPDCAARLDREQQAPSAPDALQAAEMKTLLERAIQTLPRAHRAVYLLREVQHLSTAETAACLGMSAANVKVCLHRARDGLKTWLLRSADGVELFDYPAPHCDPMTARVMALIRAQA